MLAAKEAEAGNEKTAETKVVEEEKVNEDLPKEEAGGAAGVDADQVRRARREEHEEGCWRRRATAPRRSVQLVAMSQLPETPLDNFLCRTLPRFRSESCGSHG